MSGVSAFVDTAPDTQQEAQGRIRRPGTIGLQLSGPAAPVAQALATVARRFGMTVADLTGQDRHKTVARARHVAAWVLRQHGLSYPEMGRALGDRDHSTMMHSVRVVQARIVAAPGERVALEALLGAHGVSQVREVPGEGRMLEEPMAMAGGGA